MSAGAYALGAVTLALVLAALGIIAARLRALAVPDWTGADARLVEVLIGLATAIATAQVLGAFGWFSRLPVTVTLLALAVAVVALVPRRAPIGVVEVGVVEVGVVDVGASTAPGRAPRDRITLAATVVALAGAATVFAQWSAHAVRSYREGILDGDTLWYHAPFAARFVQTGWLTRLHFVNSEPLVTFFPANSETVQALGILPFHRDVLAPVLNLGWLLLAFLAAWVLGRRWHQPAAALALVAMLASLPVFASTNAGTARNDIVGLALFLTALAIVVRSEWQGAPVALAGIAAGLTAGVKISLLGPVGLLTVAVLVALPAGRRLRLAATWLLPLMAAGLFWYVRNVARTGNPLPWLEANLGILHLSAPPLPEARVGESSLLSQLDVAHGWSQVFEPGLRSAFGPAWPLVLAGVAIGAVLALARPVDRFARVLGAAALASVALYFVTPNSAANGGLAGASLALKLMFMLNLRYALPALALGLGALLASRVVAARPRVGLGLTLIAVAVVVVNQFPRTLNRGWEWAFGAHDVEIGLLVGAVALAAVVVLLMARPSPTTLLVVAALVAIGGGAALQHTYLRHRYARDAIGLPVGAVYPWARDVHDTRIALSGDLFQYGFYGTDLSNHVQFLGRRGPHGAFLPVRTCAAWHDALRAGRYRYVAVISGVFELDPRPTADARAWTEAVPGARVAFAQGGATVYSLPSRIPRGRCPGSGAS